MHFPFPSRDDPPSHATNSKMNNDDYHNRNRNSHPSSSSSSSDEDDPFTAMRRFVDHQLSSFFGSFNPFGSFNEFFNDDRKDRVLRQQRQCDELRRRIYEEMEGRTGSGNRKFDQRESRHNQTVRCGDERREWTRQGIRDSYGMSPRIFEAEYAEKKEKGEESGGRNSWRKWWCDGHSENDNPGDSRLKGPWAGQCPRTERSENTGRVSGTNSTSGSITGYDAGEGQTSTLPDYVRIIPETLPPFYSRQYLLSSPYSPLYLELDYRLSNVRWRAAYDELLLAEHGFKLRGATHGADSKSIRLGPMCWLQRVLSSSLISKTSNSPLLIWSNEHCGGQSNNQKQRQAGVAKQNQGLEQHEQYQQDGQILRALIGGDEKANKNQYQHQRQRQPELRYEDFQTDAYEHFLNQYNENSSMPSRQSRDGKAVVTPQNKTENIDTPPKSPISKFSPASRSNSSVTPSQPITDQTKTPTSLHTTTERHVFPDGTVTTKTVLKHRFADGSEETTETDSTSVLAPGEEDNKNSTNNNNDNGNVVAISKSNNSESNNIWNENSGWPTSLAKYGLGSGNGYGYGSGPWDDYRSSDFRLGHGINTDPYDDIVERGRRRRRNGFDEFQKSGQTSLDKRGEMKSNGKDDKVNDDDEGRWKSWFWSKK